MKWSHRTQVNYKKKLAQLKWKGLNRNGGVVSQILWWIWKDLKGNPSSYSHMCRNNECCVASCMGRAKSVIYKVQAIIGMFWLLYLWTGNLSANSRKPWHQNHIVLLDCYWCAFDFASHPTLADKFTIRYKNISHALQRKSFCFVEDKQITQTLPRWIVFSEK